MSDLKAIRKYIQQAKRLEKVEPHVGYCCRLFAMQKAMQVKGKKPPEVLQVLNDLMGWLEKNTSLKLDKDEGRARVEAFALQVFSHADNTDREGKATRNTALAFHASFVLLDVLTQFGELDSDLEEKQRYAKWKAADIAKAVKEGRVPTPGGYGEEEIVAADAGGTGGTMGAMGGGGDMGNGMSVGGSFVEVPPPNGDLAGAGMTSVPQGYAEATPQTFVPTFQPQQQVSAGLPTPMFSPPSATFSPPGPTEQTDAQGTFIPPVAQATQAQGVFMPPTGQATQGGGVFMPPGSQAAQGGVFMPPGGQTQGGVFMPPVYTPSASVPAASQPGIFNPMTAQAAQTPMQRGAGGAMVISITPQQMDKARAVAEAERQLKHAASALRFDDLPDTVTKLKAALALLLPHSS